MIVVRDTFHLKFGMAREFKAAMAEGRELFTEVLGGSMRLMSDLVADSYTFVLESSFESLSDYEAAMKKGMSDEWRKLYHEKIVPLVDSGKREIFTVVE